MADIDQAYQNQLLNLIIKLKEQITERDAEIAELKVLCTAYETQIAQLGRAVTEMEAQLNTFVA